jgi:hypothetical protein
MKKLLLLPFLICLLHFKGFSQTVYVNQTGDRYHTNKCKLYTKNFEAIPLWKAKGPYGKRPCDKCHPPTKETGAVAKKKKAPKPKTAAKK